MKANSAGAFRKLPTNPVIMLFIGLMIAGFLGAGINAYFVLRDTQYDQRYLELTAELRVLSQQIATASREATEGNAAAFDTLAQSRLEFERHIGELINGTSELPSPRAMLGEDLDRLNALWQRINADATAIVDSDRRAVRPR